QLIEVDLIVLSSATLLRVWSCAAEDAAKSCCCGACGFCRSLSKRLRWAGDVGLLAGGLGLLTCAVAACFDVQGLGFSAALEMVVLSLALGLFVSAGAFKDLAQIDERFARTLSWGSSSWLKSSQAAQPMLGGSRVGAPVHLLPSAPPLLMPPPGSLMREQALHMGPGFAASAAPILPS
ncbi:unnamed protein product, partial [Polarella glacialis]